MLEKHHKLQPKPKTNDELKAALQTISETVLSSNEVDLLRYST